MIELYSDKKDCCGCTACKSICPKQAITMSPDEEGFLYPNIDEELCIDCGLCKKVCAFQNGYKTSENFEIPEVYAVKHKSDDVRKNSSSGGAFTAISDYILSQNGIIYGVTYDEKFHVIHQREETLEGRNRFRGSKYVQSDLKEVFIETNKDLINGRSVLFTGTSCQVAGLNSYLYQSKTNTVNLITLDIICHGTPSPKIFEDYILYLENKNKCKVSQYYFRSKVNGWGHTEEVVFNNGKHDYTSAISQTYKEVFYSNLCLRPSCYQCKYTNFLRPADITIADFWGISKVFPNIDDGKGISLVLVSTAKGQHIFNTVKGDIDYIESDTKECLQHNLQQPTKMPVNREQFWIDYQRDGFEYIIKNYAGYNLQRRLKKGTITVLKKFGVFEFVKKVLEKSR